MTEIERVWAWAKDEQRLRHIAEEDRMQARIEAAVMLAALKAIEDWWLRDGMQHFHGAPHAMFAVRAAIAKATGETLPSGEGS